MTQRYSIGNLRAVLRTLGLTDGQRWTVRVQAKIGRQWQTRAILRGRWPETPVGTYQLRCGRPSRNWRIKCSKGAR